MRYRRKRALSLVLLLVLAASAQAAPAEGPREAVKHELAKVLSQEKFIYRSPRDGAGDEEKSLLESLLDRLGERFKWLKERIARFFRASPVVAMVIYAMILALIVLLVIQLLKRLNLRGRSGPAPRGPGAEWFSLDFEREILKARELIDAGRFREALQSLLAGLWLYYNHAGVMSYRRSATNRECLGGLAGREEFDAVRDIVLRAEETIYAGETIGEIQCREMCSGVEEIVTR